VFGRALGAKRGGPLDQDKTQDAPARRRAPDLTAGPIGSTMLMFMLPVLGSNLVQSLNGSANAFWVSHVLGEAALTATTNANQILFLMLGAIFGMAMASNIMIGQAVGARDGALIRRVVGTCTAVFIVISLSVGLLGAALTPAILDAMRTPADARADAIAYLRVIFAALPFIYFFTFVMMAQRGLGDARTPFVFAVAQVALDIVLNPLLIMGLGPFPQLGIAGSATSTLVSQTLVLAAMLIHLYRRGSPLVIRPSEARALIPDLTVVRAMLFKGAPMGLQMIMVNLAAVAMISAVNRFGSQTAAAYGASWQLWSYIQMPSMALGVAVTAMAAQNIGADRMDRVEKVARVGVLYALALTLGPTLVILATQRWVLQLFLPAGSPSIDIAVHMNLVMIWTFAFFGVAFVLASVVRAAGVAWVPLLFMFIAYWVVRTPFAYGMMPWLGADAVWLSFPLGSMTMLIMALAYYRWGPWRSSRMIATAPPPDSP